jgi:hypothetical protein
MKKGFAYLLIIGLLLCPIFAFSLEEAEVQSSVSSSSISTLSTFPLGVYWSWERTPWVARQAHQDKWKLTQDLMNKLSRDYGINALWVVNIPDKDLVQFCQLADKYHLSIYALPEAAQNWRDDKYKESPGAVAEQITSLLSHLPALKGYVLADEPEAAEMGYMESLRQALAKRDPARLSLTVTPRRNIAALSGQTHLPVLALDIYPFFGPGNPNGPHTMDTSIAYYRHWLGELSNTADKSERLGWVMPQAFEETYGPWHYDKEGKVVYEKGAFLQWRMPRPEEIEWQFWESLRSGMKGIFYFCLLPVPNNRASNQSTEKDSPIPASLIQAGWPTLAAESSSNTGTGLLSIQGKETPESKRLGQLYKQAAPHHQILSRMKKADLQVQLESPFSSAAFIDPVNGKQILIIVNDDMAKPHQAEGIIESSQLHFQTLFTQKGEFKMKKTAEGNNTFQISIPAGGGICLISNPVYQTPK